MIKGAYLECCFQNIQKIFRTCESWLNYADLHEFYINIIFRGEGNNKEIQSCKSLQLNGTLNVLFHAKDFRLTWISDTWKAHDDLEERFEIPPQLHFVFIYTCADTSTFADDSSKQGECGENESHV